MRTLFTVYGENKRNENTISEDFYSPEFGEAQTRADELNAEEGEDGAYEWKVGRIVPVE